LLLPDVIFYSSDTAEVLYVGHVAKLHVWTKEVFSGLLHADTSTVQGDETKPNPEICKNCSSKCAYDCAQLQYTKQHRTIL